MRGNKALLKLAKQNPDFRRSLIAKLVKGSVTFPKGFNEELKAILIPLHKKELKR